MSGSRTPESVKAPRSLACVWCQQRKIKCDRSMPCSNCLKANIVCTPSTPAPARPRRRPREDLQGRLARCEELLKQYADGSTPPSIPQPQIAAESDSQSDQLMATPPNGLEPSWRINSTAKMVEHNGQMRFTDSSLWADVYEQLHAMKNIVNAHGSDGDTIFHPESSNSHDHIDLLPGDTSTWRLKDLQPEPVHIFKLWQLFVDRVNPTMKIIHVPTVQPYMVKATSDMEDIPLNYQALLFAIFSMASVSISDIEAQKLFGCTRESAIQRFNIGTKLALIKLNFLKNFNMVTLQSLQLYLCSLHNRLNKHTAWILSGIVVRIAQKMGYHRDGESLNLTPYEIEMRRRIWWQIIAEDAKKTFVSGLSNSMIARNWDTKMPQNFNDADLFPGSAEPVYPREGPTEMALCLIGYQLTSFIIRIEPAHSPSSDGSLSSKDDMLSEDEITPLKLTEDNRQLLAELENNLLEVESRYIDTNAGRIHTVALAMRPLLMSKIRETIIPMREQPEWGTEIFNHKDNLFKILLAHTEIATKSYEVMERAGFLWIIKLHLQSDMFAVMAGQLCQRPNGSLAERAWATTEMIYQFQPELFDLSQKSNATQAQLVLKAWRAREEAFSQAGHILECPDYIRRLQECVSAQRISEVTSFSPAPQMVDTNGYQKTNLDYSTLDWDTWSGINIPQSQIAASLFGGFGLGGLS
ncbi:hypothetical protein AK830_g8608 [Neonectria ditissima]|uniref:Zn(2)-C6 fungal-type domain-containing protein n=1 Tax=Neonectria ditissima TaxID=78410 RepID=A0A0P7BBW9_9HYPO|nr:hypothetical protein AK830_g8608 [Neonectria ditissima]